MAHIKALEAIVLEAKSGPCIDCGVQYPPYVKHFDHRDPYEKSFNISRYSDLMPGVDVLRAEIAKCDVVCANCHAERTHQQATRRADVLRRLDAER